MRSRRVRRIVVAVAALFAFAFVAACGPAAPPIASTPQADSVAAQINDLRSNNGIGRMTIDGDMQAHAQAEAARVAAVVRICSDLTGGMHSPELGSWYPNQGAAENLACVPGCPPNGDAVVSMWWGSPSHHNNMMNPAYNYMGTAANCNGSVMIAVGQFRSG